MTGPVESVSAVTLVTADMTASVAFYQALGFQLLYGGEDAEFTSFRVGPSFLNLQLDVTWKPGPAVWGRVIFWVDDVDEAYIRARTAGLAPLAAPSDAPWGERFFHIRDPAGHEVSLARPLAAMTGGTAEAAARGPLVTPEVTYTDAVAGITWLTDILGLVATLVVPDEDGTVMHAELEWRGGFVFIGSKGDAEPWELGPSTVCLAADSAVAVDAIHTRAQAHGADVVVALGDTPFGSHQFVVRDPEGNLWIVGTYVPEVPDPDAG